MRSSLIDPIHLTVAAVTEKDVNAQVTFVTSESSQSIPQLYPIPPQRLLKTPLEEIILIIDSSEQMQI